MRAEGTGRSRKKDCPVCPAGTAAPDRALQGAPEPLGAAAGAQGADPISAALAFPGDAAGAQGLRNTRGLGAVLPGTVLGSSFTGWSH